MSGMLRVLDPRHKCKLTACTGKSLLRYIPIYLTATNLRFNS